MVKKGQVSSHKCVGTSGSEISSIEFYQEQGNKNYTLSDRQYNNTETFDKYGKSLKMIKLSKEVSNYLLSRRITITTKYLSSKLNIIADMESREKVDSSEWKLDPKMFQRLVQLIGNPVVELFVSRLNHQLPQYIA